ncbi:integrin beta-7 isoform X1 [Gadus chalcogrammus]|uniref:integrin beta-7 isoform X1 n=2 Tax=Gadus chalcogrammus TaxID=1042646 RepID=UPI0024C4AF75|nr:integrin beta-7 isoform X1 [Gadus chalcogrammus]
MARPQVPRRMFVRGPAESQMVLLSILLPLLHPLGGVLGAKTCVPRPSCSECIQSPGCAWCSAKGFLQAGEPSERRCDAKEALTSRGCKEPYPPETDETLLMKDKELSASDDIIQLRPQQIDFQLRVGVPQTFKVSFKRAEGYPIDLYYLMDLSFSMGDDLDMIKKLSQDMVRTLQSFTKKLRIGFGSFVDKVALPYVSQMKRKRRDPSPHRGTSCQPAFSFQNLLNLTTDTAAFEKKVIGQRISANLDSPESGFDAIMQAAVCKDVIGWDDGTKILVYTSDDTFHMAGDGRLAGLSEPPDGHCHLSPSGLYDGTRFDYPSIGQLARVLTANNIQLIFAVTKNISAAYEELSKMIPQSVVGVLESDSSNVVQIIKNAYNSLSSSVVLEHHGAPQGLEVAYQAHCTSPSPGPPGLRPWSQRAECKDIKINQQVDFYVQLNMSRCLEQTEFHLSVQGISERLKVEVKMKCECDCGPVEKASPSCSGHGTLRCGICSCDPGFLGQTCDCLQSEDHVSLDEKCRHGGSSQLCSGHGSCECGKCACQRSFSGQFCECDDSNCVKSNQQLCGGNGKCVCGKCNCSGAYGGEACDCSTLDDRCQTAGSPCSGSGECLCNRCVCKGGFDGDHCSHIPNNCTKYEKCVTCLSKHKKEEVAEACGVPCEGAVLRHKKALRDAYCSFQSFLYDVTLTPQGIVHLRYAEMPSSIDKTWVIIGSSVSGILFIGLLIILISRLLLELSYRREYQSFVASQQQTNWKETRNPLFKGATTTVMNPLHMDDE